MGYQINTIPKWCVGDIVLNPFDFGNRYTEVKEKMQAFIDLNKNRLEGNYL